MSSLRPALQKNELHDTWVVLNYQNSGQSSPKRDDKSLETSDMYMPFNIEKLLKDAQNESEQNSRGASAKGSSTCLCSPTSELATEVQEEQVVEIGTDWISEWSSRSDRKPSSDTFQKFHYPSNRHNYNGRSSQPMKSCSVFSRENLYSLLFTHFVSYVLGASVLYILFKKRWIKCGQCSHV